LKLHKYGISIRPVISSTKDPSYKLSKHLVKVLNKYSTLHNYYNVTNSVNLANILTKLKINGNHKSTAYGIKDLCANTSIEEELKITKSKVLENDIQKHNKYTNYTNETNPFTELLYISKQGLPTRKKESQ